MPQKLLCVGCGEMGSAILTSLTSDTFNTTIVKPSPPHPRLENHYTDYVDAPDELSGTFDVVLISVKPQTANDVFTWLAQHTDENTLVISIMAGISEAKIKSSVNPHATVIRAMPNLAITTGNGMTAFTSTANISDAQRQTTESLFGKVENQIWVKDENALDAFTAILSSGVAYFFLTIESMAAAAQNLGFSENDAKRIARQTCLDASTLLEHNKDIDVADFRQRITSQGGTTEAALDVLLEQLPPLYNEAIKVAYKRAQKFRETS